MEGDTNEKGTVLTVPFCSASSKGVLKDQAFLPGFFAVMAGCTAVAFGATFFADGFLAATFATGLGLEAGVFAAVFLGAAAFAFGVTAFATDFFAPATTLVVFVATALAAAVTVFPTVVFLASDFAPLATAFFTLSVLPGINAPTTPPTTAPIGPATIPPATAPAAAPAALFCGMATLMSLDLDAVVDLLTRC